MWCEHCIVISISKVKNTDLKRWDQSQMWSDYADPLWEVCSDATVLKITSDVVTTNRTNQRPDVVRQDQRDLLRVHQIIVVLASFLSRGSGHRSMSSSGGFFQSTCQ
jgi:hypothetical protein